MSTKAIREALVMLTTQVPPGTVVHPKAAEALREVEAIEKAARQLVEGGGIEVLRDNDYEETPALLERIAEESQS